MKSLHADLSAVIGLRVWETNKKMSKQRMIKQSIIKWQRFYYFY